MCLIWNSAHWISNLGLLVDERADVVEVPLLDGQHVGSEAKLYFQGKHPPPENLVSDMNTFPICRGPNKDKIVYSIFALYQDTENIHSV